MWPCKNLVLSLSDGNTITGPGEIFQDAVGHLELRVTVSRELALSDFATAQTVTGATAGGFTVKAEECWPNKCRFDSRTSITHVTLASAQVVIQDPGHGGLWTKHRAYLKAAKCFGIMRLTDGPRNVELRPIPIDPNDRRFGLMRSRLDIAEASPSSEDGETALREMVTLLSLAQRCQISAPRRELLDGERVVRTILYPNDFTFDVTHPLIPWNANDLNTFFEQALPNYRAHQIEYELERLIWYYCRSIKEGFGELKFILAGVFMEAFKFYWAKNVGKLPQDVKANGLVRGFIKTTLPNGRNVHFTFEELLTKATAHLGYTASFTFIEDRNVLFHTGAAAATHRGSTSAWPQLKPELMQLYRQIDDIILRILGYKGLIHPYDSADSCELFPERTPA